MDSTKDQTAALPRIGLPIPSAEWAVFLDIDGTLLDIAPTPDAVVVPPDLPKLLVDASHALGGALALVSGRSIPWIDETLKPCRLPTAGQHGAEVRLEGNGTVQYLVERPNLQIFRNELPELLAHLPGVLVEDKGSSVAIHYRALPESGHEVATWIDLVLHEIGDAGLHVITGKMVFEIKSRAAWKERAIEIFMEVPPFAGRMPVVLGDDRTDEDAFVAARRRGGLAIQVGPGKSDHSTGWVDSPATVRSWLAALPATLGAVKGSP